MRKLFFLTVWLTELLFRVWLNGSRLWALGALFSPRARPGRPGVGPRGIADEAVDL